MIDEYRLIETFKKLVRIDSLSLQEGKLVSYLKKELRALGLRHYEVGKIEGGEIGSLVVEVPGSGRQRILLNAHLDTVAPGENIKPLEKKGYFCTNGSTILGADDKAGITAILEVLKVLKERKLKHPTLKVVFTVAEEIGLLGSKALPKKIFKDVDFGFTLDGGDIDKIINKAPSQNNITAKVLGRAAHAGLHPEEGINAIKVASVAIAKMKLGRIDKVTTANIGVIKGGKATNIVPDEVELKGEARSHSLAKLKRQTEHMKRKLLETCRKYGARLKLKVGQVYRAFEVSQKEEVLQRALSAYKKSGIKPKVVSSGGGSDANIFNKRGIPTVILGVGADRVHTPQERILVEDMVKGTRLLLNIVT